LSYRHGSHASGVMLTGRSGWRIFADAMYPENGPLPSMLRAPAATLSGGNNRCRIRIVVADQRIGTATLLYRDAAMDIAWGRVTTGVSACPLLGGAPDISDAHIRRWRHTMALRHATAWGWSWWRRMRTPPTNGYIQRAGLRCGEEDQ